MSKIFFIAFLSIAVISCTNNTNDVVDNRIALRTDTINVVKLTDTLVIFESICRGCEFEKSANFAISDSLNMLKLVDVITTDNNPAGMDGGNISKDLILVPVKTGTTIFKLYKFWTQEKKTADSAGFTSYKIEVKQ
jgi:hypothetical protein